MRCPTMGKSITTAISEALAKRATENEDTAVNVDAMWKDFCENYLSCAENGLLCLDDKEFEQLSSFESIAGTGSLKQIKSFGKARNPLRVLSKVASTAAAVVVLFFSGVGAANAAGYDAWNKVASWTEYIFTFRGRGGNLEVSAPASHEPDGSGNYASLQDALDAYGITLPMRGIQS